MCKYNKLLQHRNKELQKKIADADTWIPIWINLTTNTNCWNYTNGFFIYASIYATIISNNPQFYVTANSRTEITKSIQEAKNWAIHQLALYQAPQYHVHI
jgi:hypothetical protein